MPVLFKKRAAASGASSNLRKKTPDIFKNHSTYVESDVSDASDHSDEHEESSAVPVFKRAKTIAGNSIASNKAGEKKADIGLVNYKIEQNNKEIVNGATKENVFYKIEREEEMKRQSERDKFVAATKEDQDGIYKGASGYKKYIGSDKETVQKKFGPMKAATNVRSTTMIDYQPDVCKDYKQTGYCGYGDSCKFLHSREDYKAGWAIDKDWEKAQEGRSTGALTDDTKAEKDIPDIPFKCVICKDDYKSPIVTPCKHYFCEGCFLKEYRKKPGCYICGKSTGGVILPAKDLKQKLEKRRG